MTAATAQRPIRQLLLGTLFIVLAYFFVAAMSALAKVLTDTPVGVIIFFQNAISLALSLPWALRHGLADIRTGRLPLHCLRAISGLIGVGLLFVAVKAMSLVDAVMLANATPLFIPFVGYLWLRARITPLVGICLIVGFLGVGLVLQPSPALLKNPQSLLATAAALFSAIALVAVNRLSSTEKPDTILFYYFLIATIATAPIAIFTWRTPHGDEWVTLLGIGLSMALAQLFIILAYERATAARLAPFNYSVVVFSGLIGWLVWHHVPDLIALSGMVLIALGGTCSIVLGHRHGLGHPLGHGHWWRRCREMEQPA